MSGTRRGDMEKERHWRRVIREAARSGVSIRQFCRGQGVKESQFYWWQRRLKDRGGVRKLGGRRRRQGPVSATFALVSDAPGALEAGVELVLSDGRRLRIGRGVDEETLRRVLVVLESRGC